MRRPVALFLVLGTFMSCSKDDEMSSTPPVEIPDIINGYITEFNVTPIDIKKPDKGTFFISANNNIYKVDFNAVPKSESNAILIFDSDTILTDRSREFANLGKDAIAYNP